jgi:hypothetical protein
MQLKNLPAISISRNYTTVPFAVETVSKLELDSLICVAAFRVRLCEVVDRLLYAAKKNDPRNSPFLPNRQRSPSVEAEPPSSTHS